MRSMQVLQLLRAFESRNVTAIEADYSGPIVWERAQGLYVWDAEGKKYLDLTAAFGVAAAGHANARVVKAGQRQMSRLLHAMGDVHPHALKAALAKELSRVTFERWATQAYLRGLTKKGRDGTSLAPRPKGKTIFCNSGFEAVEAALKTALLATGRPGVIAFAGAYHGLGYGSLNATHREFFRSRFQTQLGGFAQFVPFPRAGKSGGTADLEEVEKAVRRGFREQSVGAILVEPVQGRGGIRVPPAAFLPLLRQLCDEHGALLILDEVYTGFGRTGRWFACEYSATIPDLICLGKALTGGFPLSACVGRAAIMDAAWPPSQGEAIHTSTFLGHPVGCAMALAQMAEIRRQKLVVRSAELGKTLLQALSLLQPPPSLLLSARGLGLMAGLELRLPDGSPATARTWQIIQAMLQRGFILLPEGEHSNVIGFTPPLTITRRLLEQTLEELQRQLR